MTKKASEVLTIEEVKKMKEHFFEVEYENTINEGWTHENNSNEAKEFLKMSKKEKENYATKHTNEYVEKLMDSVSELLTSYGNDYFIDVFNINLKKRA